MPAATPSVRDDLAIVKTYSRELRELVTDLHDDPLSEDLARRLVALLVHDAPEARAARDRLNTSDSQPSSRPLTLVAAAAPPVVTTTHAFEQHLHHKSD